ncbi:BspC domain-containing protein [Cupriavidus sp. RAF12]|uniref:BspC domain-containing protein n=1 Tax=Cupriavidus sp. RAF12 TaxID=3233050 RepID=UPI003F92C9FE
MIRRISELFGSQLRMLTAAVAGAIALAGCATAPTDEAAATTTGGTAAASATPSNGRAGQASGPGAKPAPIVSSTAPTKTVTLPDKGRVSLAEYRTQMREQLMKSENASSNVADCAAHASWVVPRSASYDALKIPTGALSSEQATVEPWNGRFSAGKQAVPVTSVVTFSATAHKRRGEAQWQPVKVRCGYDDSMMLAYELLDSNGDTISEAAAAPAVATPTPSHSSSAKGKGKSKGKSSAKSTSSKSTSSAKSTSSSSSSSSKSKKKQ